MSKKKLALVMGVLALVTVLGVASVGGALAQTTTPPADTTPTTPDSTQTTPKLGRFGFGLGLRGGDSATFDAVAEALGLTPTQLFEQLHSGKTLSEIAEAQGVDLTTVQTALNASRVQAMKDKIAAAVAAGTITQEQADWMLQGIEKGWSFGGRGFGFGFGGRGHGRGMGGLDTDKGDTNEAQPTPSTTGLGFQS